MITSFEVLHLGDELLLGLRANSHLEYLGRTFAAYGVPMVRDYVIRDHREEILETLSQVWGRSDLLITTGGLGPTVDDITRQAVSEFLGVPLVFNHEVQTTIEARFRSFGRVMTPNNLRQCYQLEGSEILANGHGTAPGLWWERDGKLLVMLPGPPNELKPMVENQVIPRLIERGMMIPKKGYLQLRTCGVGESILESKIQSLLADRSDVAVAYCVHSGVVDVRLSSIVTGGVDAVVEGCASRIADALGDDFLGFGDCDLARSVIKHLVELGKTLAVAESCTGGLIGAALTDVPGASAAFIGGQITYCDEAKILNLGVPASLVQQHGSVSHEVAVAMATAVAEQFGSSYGLSATGYAGPDGGDAQYPVGTVFIGYHAPCGAWSRRLDLKGDRNQIRQRTVVYALDLMRRMLQQYETEDRKHRD
jgi:nicotinamide-nucleotide amidase